MGGRRLDRSEGGENMEEEIDLDEVLSNFCIDEILDRFDAREILDYFTIEEILDYIVDRYNSNVLVDEIVSRVVSLREIAERFSDDVLDELPIEKIVEYAVYNCVTDILEKLRQESKFCNETSREIFYAAAEILKIRLQDCVNCQKKCSDLLEVLQLLKEIRALEVANYVG